MSDSASFQHVSSPSQSHRRARTGALFAGWLFPVLAFITATLFMGGNLGKSTDDYAINLRDPVTNAIPTPFNPLQRYPFFWRPLHNTLCFGVGTLWPEANRSVHIAVALSHALACLGLFAFLRQLTRTRLAPGIAALIFAVYPLHGEVAFWFCTMSTSIGAAIFFAAALLLMRYARAPGHALIPLVVTFVLFFIIMCFYEQSAAPAAAVPFVVLGCCPCSLGWPTRITRAVLATLAAGLGCVLYLVLLLLTAPPGARGGAGSFVTGVRLAERFHQFSSGMRFVMFAERGSQVIRGSLKLGWETLHSPPGLVAGAALLAAGVLWMIWAVRRGGPRLENTGRPHEPQSTIWLLAAGLATFVGGWLPVFAIDHQIVELRNTYIPLLGLAMVLAALLDAILALSKDSGSPFPGFTRGIVAIAGIALVALGTTCLVGYQAFLHARWKQDQYEIAELKRLVPNPPPHTVFVPFRTNATATDTGQVLFDRVRHGVFETPWSAHNAIVFAYRRSDISSTSCSPWLPPSFPPLARPGPDGASWTNDPARSMIGPLAKDPEGGLRLPWANMVGFITTPPKGGNQVRLIRRIDMESPDHRDLALQMPIVQTAIETAKAAGAPVPTAIYRFPTIETPRPDLISIDFWEFADGSPCQFINVRPWNIDHKATWLACDGSARSRMSVQMPPLDRPENLLIRATIAEYDLDPARNPIARVQELVVTMASAPAKELAVLRLDPTTIRVERRWLPLVVQLPVRPPPTGDRIVVSLRPTNDAPVRTDPQDKTPVPEQAKPGVLPVWVTHGYEQSIVAP